MCDIPLLKIRQSQNRLIFNMGTYILVRNRYIETTPGPVFCLLLLVSSDCAQPITGQVTEVTCPVIGQAQPELTPNKRQKTGPDVYCSLN